MQLCTITAVGSEPIIVLFSPLLTALNSYLLEPRLTSLCFCSRQSRHTVQTGEPSDEFDVLGTIIVRLTHGLYSIIFFSSFIERTLNILRKYTKQARLLLELVDGQF